MGRGFAPARRLAVLTAVSAFSFGAMIQVAAARHWHDWNQVGGSQYHGLVHGSSTTDGYYDSQVHSHSA